MSNSDSPDTIKKVNQLLFGENIASGLIFVFYFNCLFTLMRLQNFPGLSFLGAIRLPALLTAIVIFGFSKFVFSGNRSKIFTIVFIFLVFEALRGLIGFLVYQDFVLNDALQFYTWVDIFMDLFTIMAPVAYLSSFSSRIRGFVKYLVFLSIILSLWSITHAGMGPGGYIGDENDNCMVLLTLIPMCILFSTNVSTSFIGRLIGVMSTFLLVGGAIRTNSRGGFLGLVAVFLFLFLVSQRKVVWIVCFVLGSLVVIPFVPAEYYKEIKSIQTDSTTAKKSTIKERLETWGIIFRMWKDPRNTLIGVGLANAKFNMGPYEPDDVNRKSLVGRVAHSFYFQILGDLGLWGIYVFGSIIAISVLTLKKINSEIKDFKNKIFILLANTKINKSIFDQKKLKKTDHINLLNYLSTEIIFIEAVSRMLICSWIGFLVAGLGISVSYYPTFWLLAAFGVGLSLYFQKVKLALSLIESEL